MSLNRLLTPSKRWLIAKLLTYSIPFFSQPNIDPLDDCFIPGSPSKGEPADIYFNLNSNSQDFYVSPMTKELFSFLHCASSYVSSKNFGQSRQSYIGCTCLTFLHCVFSNVSSNCLHRRMHSHIGCTCLTFLHCVFSNVTSKHLHKMMHNHTGYICLAFLHCVFSNVSSNC